jgi:hypothetical protein
MPDKKREEFFRDLFLDHYNSLTGKHYEFLRRPEEDKPVVEHYDFLCKERHLENDYLAIEENRLIKSTENVGDNKKIEEIKFGVERILKDKNILVDREYWFLLEFKNVPGKKERDRYVHKIAETIEKTIIENKGYNICERVILNTVGYECIKEFRLISVQAGKRIVLASCPKSSEITHVEGNTIERLREIFKDCNKKLALPKMGGKKTILLITNDWDEFVGADQYNISSAMQSLSREEHQHIEEIFYINKKNLTDGYDIHKVK